MTDKKRVTVRSERTGRAKHNDRSFIKDYADKHQDDPEWAEHIDMDRIGNNQYWQCINGIEGFENVELAYYKKHYSAAIEQTNENYRRNRHPERCKTVEDVYRNRQTQPEEVILQIGDMHTAGDIPAEQFIACINQYWKWLNQWSADHGDCMHILTMAMHLDEATPHVHMRRVWDYVDSDGNRHIGQNEALKRAGLTLPDPSKKRGRYNNLKMSFDQIARAKWQEICMEHGIEIETVPRPSRKHKQKAEYIADQMQEQIDRQQEHLKSLDEKISQKESQQAALQDDIKENSALRSALNIQIVNKTTRLDDLEENIASRQAEFERLEDDFKELESRYYKLQEEHAQKKSEKEALDEDIHSKKSQIDNLDHSITEKKSKRSDLDADLADSEQKIADCKGQIGELEERIQQKTEILWKLNIPRIVCNLFCGFGQIVRDYIDQNAPITYESSFRRYLKESDLPDMPVKEYESQTLTLWDFAAGGYEEGAELEEGYLQQTLKKLRSPNKKKKQGREAR